MATFSSLYGLISQIWHFSNLYSLTIVFYIQKCYNEIGRKICEIRRILKVKEILRY